MICCIIQARMTSKRLPGKVLKEIDGRPMLKYMIDRVKAARTLERVILATSVDPTDDPVAEFCRKEGIECFRGNLNDVTDRYYQAAKSVNADVIVRLTADCPLIDPAVIDAVVQAFLQSGCDYGANTEPPPGTFPDGMDVEVFSFKAFHQLWQEATKPADREHVTYYFWQNPQMFKLHRHDLAEDFSSFRLTVDYPSDFEMVTQIIQVLYQKNPLFTLQDVLDFLRKNPQVYEKNREHCLPGLRAA